VLELAKKNAHVIVASRTPSKALAVIEEIKAETKNEKVEFIQLDLLSLASVTKFVSEFKAKNLPLHLLLNNAGVMACPFALSEDGYESQFATNHVSNVIDDLHVKFHCKKNASNLTPPINSLLTFTSLHNYSQCWSRASLAV
jgi:NAD(P)-dependent dehydrogenase (short-subunit alcohol dehydrogenase family)